MGEHFEISQVNGTWSHDTLPTNIVIGDRCYLERRDSFGRFRSIRNPGLVLGDGVRVLTWTTFNVDPDGVVTVGRDSILVGAVFMCAERVEIGERVLISYGVTIADSDFHPKDPSHRRDDARANSPSGDRSARPEITSRPVTIGDDVVIGIGAIILKGATIGPGCRIEAGAVVTGIIPPGATVAGNPGRILGGPA